MGESEWRLSSKSYISTIVETASNNEIGLFLFHSICCFQYMLKRELSVKATEIQATKALKEQPKSRPSRHQGVALGVNIVERQVLEEDRNQAGAACRDAWTLLAVPTSRPRI
ncbi:MAG TPA: hypothetical protein VNW97_09100 [Candidatus Saccharimonadales bacterium]|nr:hypothetical protein [Candidatus Saccharimonadales bacterium]